MRLLLVETQITGHHLTYLKGLLSALKDNDEYLIVLPETSLTTELPEDKICLIPFEKEGKRHYFQWLQQLTQIARQFQPDMIHLTYGDDLYRYMGAGLNSLKQIASLIITYHQIRRSTLRDFSIKRIAKRCHKVVVHTKQLSEDLQTIGIHNIEHIEYPQFANTESMDQQDALKELGISETQGKVLLALGGTREDKGLDILLEALRGVKEPFHLIIAGKEEQYSRDFIEKNIGLYRNQVSMFLEFLSEEKLQCCLNAADIMVLPYRKSFDGASGPLGEGVWLRKEIVGPSHGSLKQMIKENHLGKLFISEDPESLGSVLEKALSEEWKPDSRYEDYRTELDPVRFADHYRKLYQGEKR